MLKGNVAAAVVVAGLVFGSASVLAQGRATPEQTRQRIQLSFMENAIKEAVRTGGRNVVKQLAEIAFLDPISVEGMLEGPPEVEGVKVSPHGVVFFVRVPRMNAMASMLPEMVRGKPKPPAVPVAQGQQGRPERVTAQSIPSTEVLSDPATAYRRSVTDELIIAVLDFGGTLQVMRNEYVTVAARRNTPLNQLNLTDEVRTLTITVSGAVLEDLQQKKIARDDARKQVVVRED